MMEPRVRAVGGAFASLDVVNISDVFDRRPKFMQTVPVMLRGVFRSAMKLALQEILDGTEAESHVRATRGWKLFLLLPRMLLFRPARGGLVPRKQLEARFKSFHDGRWIQLLNEGAVSSEKSHTQSARRRRRAQDDDDEAKRAARALSLEQVGDLSAARQALKGASMAPRTSATLRALSDPERRPPVPREGLSREVQQAEPAEQFELEPVESLTCLRKARRGAAPGPSGMTSDHLLTLLESEADSELFTRVGSLLAVARVPHVILEAIRLGRLTALSKPDGWVRGIVVGDILRRLVARTTAKQFSKKAEAATAPFQYALSTKAGCECVTRILQALSDRDPEAHRWDWSVRSDLQKRHA